MLFRSVKSCVNGLTTDASGSINGCIASDISLKTNVATFDIEGMSLIKKLRPVFYEWNDAEKEKRDAKQHVGFVAQEVQRVLPQAVVSAGEGLLGVDANSINAALVKAVQELDARIALLENRKQCVWNQ